MNEFFINTILHFSTGGFILCLIALVLWFFDGFYHIGSWIDSVYKNYKNSFLSELVKDLTGIFIWCLSVFLIAVILMFIVFGIGVPIAEDIKNINQYNHRMDSLNEVKMNLEIEYLKSKNNGNNSRYDWR